MVFSMKEDNLLIEWWHKKDDEWRIPLIEEDAKSVEARNAQELHLLLNEMAWLISRR